MTLDEWMRENRAATRYLLGHARIEDAAGYIASSLIHGPRDSGFWELMEAAFGKKWNFPPDQLDLKCLEIVHKLRELDSETPLPRGEGKSNLYSLDDERLKRQKQRE